MTRIVTHAEASELARQAANGAAIRASMAQGTLRTHNSDDDGVRAMTAHSVLPPADRARLQHTQRRARKAQADHVIARRQLHVASDDEGVKAMAIPSLVAHIQAKAKRDAR
jgi:nucleotide-binding universal stress UspA family protein